LAAIAGSALFFLNAPGVAAGAVSWWITGWKFHPPIAGQLSTRVLGALLIFIGLAVLIEAFGRFALVGRRTPALGRRTGTKELNFGSVAHPACP
jgi:hypothetical protein